MRGKWEGRRIAGAAAVIGGAAPLILGAEAHATGFALREQSASAQGNAYAGVTAAAEDPSAMFFNPAALGFLDGHQVQTLLNYIAPHVELESVAGTTVLGTPIGGPGQDDDVAPNAFVPALYGMLELPAGLRAGLAVNAPFGLQTEYDDDWVGRYHAVRSELRSIDVNPVLAWRPLPWLALGAGLQAQYVEAELTNAVDFGTIGAVAGIPGAVPAAQDGFVDVEGDDWGFGFTAGVLVEPRRGTRIGLGYRSEVKHELRGQAEFDLDAAGIGAALRAGTGAFADSDVRADLTTPGILSAGIYQEIGERWAVMGEVAWTDWSRFEEVRIRFDNPAQPDNVTRHEWEDSVFVALGATWRPSETLVLRGGVAFDQGPVPDGLRTPRIPDNDRYWVALGLGWRPLSWITVDASYAHIFVESAGVSLDAADPGNAFRGNLEADYANSIDLFAVSARFVF